MDSFIKFRATATATTTAVTTTTAATPAVATTTTIMITIRGAVPPLEPLCQSDLD